MESSTCGQVGWLPTHWAGVKGAGSKIGEPAHDATVTMSPSPNCPTCRHHDFGVLGGGGGWRVVSKGSPATAGIDIWKAVVGGLGLINLFGTSSGTSLLHVAAWGRGGDRSRCCARCYPCYSRSTCKLAHATCHVTMAIILWRRVSHGGAVAASPATGLHISPLQLVVHVHVPLSTLRSARWHTFGMHHPRLACPLGCLGGHRDAGKQESAV